jgi:hypothetical protein
MKRTRVVACAASGVVLVALTGCSPSSSAAEGVARHFVQAVAQHDGKAACALLTPKAAESAGGAAKVPCPQAVLHLDEHGADVASAQVWGDTAIVHVGSDTVFLRRLPAGWRVSAAGCTKQPAAPYDCDVEA